MLEKNIIFFQTQHAGYSNRKESIMQNDAKSAWSNSGGQDRLSNEDVVLEVVVKADVVLVLVLTVDDSVKIDSSGVAS